MARLYSPAYCWMVDGVFSHKTAVAVKDYGCRIEGDISVVRPGLSEGDIGPLLHDEAETPLAGAR